MVLSQVEVLCRVETEERENLGGSRGRSTTCFKAYLKTSKGSIDFISGALSNGGCFGWYRAGGVSKRVSEPKKRTEEQ